MDEYNGTRHGPRTESELIVVGVDGSPDSRAALDFALAERERRRARLHVVAVYNYPEYSGLGYPYPVLVAPESIADCARSIAQEMIDKAVSGLDPKPPVRLIVRRGPAADVLVKESAGAAMLVIGHRGRGAFASMLIGSVGMSCVLRAACPVTVVRPTADDSRTGHPVAASTR